MSGLGAWPPGKCGGFSLDKVDFSTVLMLIHIICIINFSGDNLKHKYVCKFVKDL